MRCFSPRILVGLFWLAAGCTGGDEGPAALAPAGPAASKGGSAPLFVLPASLDDLGKGCSVDGVVVDGECASSFFDHPFPSDFRRDEAGKVRFGGFPNPKGMPILDDYTSVADRLLDGFSPQATGFVRFKGPIDPSTLPKTPAEAVDPGAVAQLIDVDDASPEKGKRRPISLFYREKQGVYWGSSTLAFTPTFGFPLRPRTRYAFVVTSGLKAPGGAAVGRSPQLDAVLGLPGGDGGEVAARLREAWAPALKGLDAAGVSADKLVHLTVFTTSDPAAELLAVRDDVRANVEPPTARDWAANAKLQKAGVYDVYEGMYGPSPDYQEGKLPFTKFNDGGAFAFENGKPRVQRMFDLRFALAVPDAQKCPMPAEGYPVVLYAHGTGGDYHSYLNDKTAEALAERCLASMGVDQIFHGTRPGAPTGPNADNEIALLFFNIQNPIAARTNGRQSAVDEVQRARLFTESRVVIPASASATGAEIRFDPARVLFFGHSQGGQNGPLFLAIDDAARGGVLSGSGSIITITLLEKTEPSPSVAAAVRTIFLNLKSDESEELNYWHPALALAQSLVDAVDPIHYVGKIVREPRAGFAPKSIYQTEGIRKEMDGSFVGDSYTPPRSIEVQAVATGLPLQTPSIRDIPEMSLAGLVPVAVPAGGISGNLAGGKASGILAQWPQPSTSDGHFVVFRVPEARKQAAQFCRNLADDPIGRVPAP